MLLELEAGVLSGLIGIGGGIIIIPVLALILVRNTWHRGRRWRY